MQTLESNTNLLPNGRVKAIIKRNTKDYCGSVDTDKLIK